MAKILLTGGNGFLGSAVVRRLVKDGHDVACLVRPSSDLSEIQGLPVSIVKGDVTDKASVAKALDDREYLFHLAGLIAYRKADRERMDRVNIGGTRNVVEACVEAGIRRLVHISSVVTVGAGFSRSEILNENSEYNLSQLNLGYFESKRAAELLVRETCREKGLDAVILNPSTIYGAGDARKSSRKTQVKVAQGRFPFYTAGGVSVVHVDRCVDGIIAGWEKGRTGERYILSGENVTIYDLFAEIARAAGVEPPRYKLPSMLLHLMGFVGDTLTAMGRDTSLSRENAWTATLYHWFDSSKAQRELGFNPGSAKEAIGESVRWMKDHGLLRSK